MCRSLVRTKASFSFGLVHDLLPFRDTAVPQQTYAVPGRQGEEGEQEVESPLHLRHQTTIGGHGRDAEDHSPHGGSSDCDEVPRSWDAPARNEIPQDKKPCDTRPTAIFSNSDEDPCKYLVY